MRILLIGDIHGQHLVHRKRMQRAERNNLPTIQLGDCGFSYGYMKEFDPRIHRILGGNHDNYPELVKIPHYLGDFGTVFSPKLGFVRGALSIDKDWRVIGTSWWPEEELSMPRAIEALKWYESARPEVMLSHDCPREAQAGLSNAAHKKIPSITSELLSQMFEAWKPKLWVFGHYHERRKFEVGGTTFQALEEFGTIEVDVPEEEG